MTLTLMGHIGHSRNCRLHAGRQGSCHLSPGPQLWATGMGDMFEENTLVPVTAPAPHCPLSTGPPGCPAREAQPTALSQLT